MVDGAVRVTQRVEIAIRTPAIADGRRAWFDPFTYNSRQRVGGSVRDGGKKCFAGPTLDTAKHPLTLNIVPFNALSPTDLLHFSTEYCLLFSCMKLITNFNLSRSPLKMNP